MFEARIEINSLYGIKKISIEAGSIGMLRDKCLPYMENVNVTKIQVVDITSCGYFKADFLNEDELI